MCGPDGKQCRPPDAVIPSSQDSKSSRYSYTPGNRVTLYTPEDRNKGKQHQAAGFARSCMDRRCSCQVMARWVTPRRYMRLNCRTSICGIILDPSTFPQSLSLLGHKGSRVPRCSDVLVVNMSAITVVRQPACSWVGSSELSRLDFNYIPILRVAVVF